MTAGVRLALAAAVLLGLGPPPARAHETLHEIERGKAVAVRAYFVDGEALAYSTYEVYSPADPKIPHQKGRTDRAGWLAFVPDAPGPWRVKVIDDTGHGLDLQVDAAVATGSAATSPGGGTVTRLAFVLRPLVGLAVIGVVFAALVLAYRKREPSP